MIFFDLSSPARSGADVGVSLMPEAVMTDGSHLAPRLSGRKHTAPNFLSRTASELLRANKQGPAAACSNEFDMPVSAHRWLADFSGVEVSWPS